MKQTQEMLMRQTLCEEENSSNDTHVTSGATVTALRGIDPFLSTTDLHNRQESSDSGVGLGSNFNLGCIPEDQPPDEMDLSEDLGGVGKTNTNGTMEDITWL